MPLTSATHMHTALHCNSAKEIIIIFISRAILKEYFCNFSVNLKPTFNLRNLPYTSFTHNFLLICF